MNDEPNDDLLAIRQDHLDEDAAGHPRLMFLWGKAFAVAKMKAKQAKNAHKVLEAELDRDIRLCPADYRIEKLTEAAVKACIYTHPSYARTWNELVEAEYEEDILDQFIKALHTRGEQIGNEVKLHGQQYWSKPPVTQGTRQAVMDQAAAAIIDPQEHPKVRTMRSPPNKTK